MRRVLKLQHHAHTGKVLSHHHTSYRAIALILLLAGFVIAGTQWCAEQAVKADSLYVTATVPATLATQPSFINNLNDGDTTTSAFISVSGTCEVATPSLSVVIFDNSNFASSTPCRNDGTFVTQITLSPGLNEILAKTINVTNGYGPDSTPVLVTYNPPNPPATPNPASPSSSSSTSPTLIKVGSKVIQPIVATPASAGLGAAATSPTVMRFDSPIVTFGPLKKARVACSINQGKPPYKVRVDWGDGTSTTFDVKDSSTQYFDHHYDEQSNYLISVKVIDSEKKAYSTTISAATTYVPPPVGSGSGSQTKETGTETDITHRVLVSATYGYASLVGVVAALWVWTKLPFSASYALAHMRPSPPARSSTGKRVVKRRR
jgi:hypothetical protein